MVGVEGFEPPTSCSQSRRATRLRYTPLIVDSVGCFQPSERVGDTTKRSLPRQSSRRERHHLKPEKQKGAAAPFGVNGAPGEIRTPDHQVRSLVLYPTELRARTETFPADDAAAQCITVRHERPVVRRGIILIGAAHVNLFFFIARMVGRCED